MLEEYSSRVGCHKDKCAFLPLRGCLLGEGLRFSSHFSGIGCAEEAMRLLLENFRKSNTSTTTPRASCVSSCENNRACQRQLSMFQQPDHIFLDILEAFPGLVMDHMDQTASLQQKWKQVRQALRLGNRVCLLRANCAQPHMDLDCSGSPCQPWSRAGSVSSLLQFSVALKIQLY